MSRLKTKIAQCLKSERILFINKEQHFLGLGFIAGACRVCISALLAPSIVTRRIYSHSASINIIVSQSASQYSRVTKRIKN